MHFGEEFGNALQTRQQNIKIKFDPTVMDIEGYDKDVDTLSLGDLLEGEERKFVLNIYNQDEFNNMSIIIDYIDCVEALPQQKIIKDKDIKMDEIKVSEVLNIQDVSNSLNQYLESKVKEKVIDDCISRMKNSTSKDTITTKRLITFLEQQSKIIDFF